VENFKETRWRQRFSNLSRAFDLYQEAVNAVALNRLEKEGLIQRFEYTFELSWKTMKDFLEGKGIETPYPRDVLKQAFAAGLIRDGDIWMRMLDQRNLLSHTYDEKTFEEASTLVRGVFYTAVSELMGRLTSEL
jgi:nucleotidyltransferase substrate binding protein (TIGR01987 family)